LYTDFPQYVQFYPTLKCNLSCAFCFNRGISSKKEISFADFERLVSIISDVRISDVRIKEIDILGGEPTLHTGFMQMMEVLSKKGFRTTISSNGSHVYLLKELSRNYNGGLIKVGISLNSGVIDRELHEYIIQYQPMVKSVCLRERTIPEVARKYIRLRGLEYYLLFMDAVRKKDLENCIPFYEFLKKVKDLKNTYGNLKGVFCSGFVPDIENYPVLQYVRCPAGTTKLSVLPDGSVYPCYLFFRNKEFRLGNIFVDDFSRIWKNPILDFFRIFEKNICSRTECELFFECHGGCPAVSFLIYNDIKRPDPRCLESYDT